jgi:hypothetical protein
LSVPIGSDNTRGGLNQAIALHDSQYIFLLQQPCFDA